MSGASWPLQQAVFTALTTALSPVKVFDAVPQGTPFPYATIGDDTSGDWSTKTGDGEQIFFFVHVWSHAAGKKEAKQIAGTAYNTFHNKPQNLAVEGYKVVLVQFDFGTSMLDEDGVTRHDVSRYRALLNPTS